MKSWLGLAIVTLLLMGVGAAWPTPREQQYRGSIEHVGAFLQEVVSSHPRVQARSARLDQGTHHASKSSPTVLGDAVYVGGGAGSVVALKRSTLARLWTSTLPTRPVYGVHATPAVDDRRVYIAGYDGVLYALDRGTGKVRWQTSLGDAIGSSATLWQDRLFIGVEVAVPHQTRRAEGFVAAVDRATGRLLFRSPNLGGEVHATPSLNPTRHLLFAGSNGGTFYALSQDTGRIVWRFVTHGEIKSTAALWDDRVVFTCWDKSIYCLDQGDGRLLWRVGTAARTQSSPAIDPQNRMVYYGSHDGTVRALRLDDGHLVWERQLPGPVVSSCTLVSARSGTKMAVVGCYDRRVYGLSLDSGATLFALATQGPVTSIPVVDHGDLFVSGDDGYVYRLH